MTLQILQSSLIIRALGSLVINLGLSTILPVLILFHDLKNDGRFEADCSKTFQSCRSAIEFLRYTLLVSDIEYFERISTNIKNPALLIGKMYVLFDLHPNKNSIE